MASEKSARARHIERAKAAGIKPSTNVIDLRGINKDPVYSTSVVPGEFSTVDNLKRKKK